MKKVFLPLALLSFVLWSFHSETTLEGIYIYAGGTYNGKAALPSKDYILQRRYNDKEFEGTFIEPGQDTLVYEQGEYKLLQDTCLEKQTYSKQPSKTLNITVPYTYVISNDTLKFFGKLPNGITVQENWKKVSR